MSSDRAGKVAAEPRGMGCKKEGADRHIPRPAGARAKAQREEHGGKTHMSGEGVHGVISRKSR